MICKTYSTTVCACASTRFMGTQPVSVGEVVACTYCSGNSAIYWLQIVRGGVDLDSATAEVGRSP